MRPEEAIADAAANGSGCWTGARRFAAQLDGRAAVREVVVVGSVARADLPHREGVRPLARFVLAGRQPGRLRKLDPQDRTRIVAGLRDLVGEADHLGVQALGASQWVGLRIGDYSCCSRRARWW